MTRSTPVPAEGCGCSNYQEKRRADDNESTVLNAFRRITSKPLRWPLGTKNKGCSTVNGDRAIDDITQGLLAVLN